jgi:hypothetical protein
MTIPVKTPKVATSDLKLEAVVIPVADVDRARQFYEKERGQDRVQLGHRACGGAASRRRRAWRA